MTPRGGIESLAGLAPRLRQRVGATRLISQVSFQLVGETAFADAVRESVAWMRNRSSSIPKEASKGEPFQILGGGAHPAEAVRIDGEGGSFWAATLDDPDKDVPRRTWVTEISVGQMTGTVVFGARLVNVTRGEDPVFEPSRPGIVRQVISDLVVLSDGLRLRDQPEFVEDDETFEAFVTLLSNPRRRLPIIAVARTASGLEAIDPQILSERICGVAHVFVLDENASWRLTRELGKSQSVFLGAARIYNRGFSPATGNPFDHPLWLTREVDTSEVRRFRANQIAERIFSQSTRPHGDAEEFPRFDFIRQKAASKAREQAKKQGTSDSELLKLFEADNVALKDELDKQKAELTDSLKMASEIIEATERERDEARSDLYALRTRVHLLEAAIRNRGEVPHHDHLQNMGRIAEWAANNLAGQIWISPKAIRETEKNGRFEDVAVFERALLILRDYFVPMKREPNSERRTAYLEELRVNNFEDQPCFAQKGAIEGYPEYSVVYNSKKYWCEDHIKFGSGYDPRRMFRIYYHWLEDEGVLLIGFMPTHLDNKITS